LAVGFDSLLPVLAGAAVRGVLGLGAGALIGGACFSVMAMTGSRRRPSVESELARRDPMTVIKVLVVAWALGGLIFGSTWGGVKGLSWDARPDVRDGPFLWGFVGSILGSALAALAWLAWEARRTARRRARILQGVTSAGEGDAADRPRG
jgi:hypothetical protein